MMVTVPGVGQAYANCEQLTLQSEQRNHDLFRQFSQQVNEFRWAAREIDLDPDWSRLLGSMRRYRYFAGSTPLPFHHPALLGNLDMREAENLVTIGQYTYPSVAAAAARALGSLRELVQSGGPSPLLEPVLVRTQDADGVLALNERLMAPAVLEEIGAAATGRVVLPAAALARPEHFSRIVVIGDVRNYPESIFSAPRAPAIDVVAYAWQKVIWRPGVSLAGAVAGRAVTMAPTAVPAIVPASLGITLQVAEPDRFFEADVFAREMQHEADQEISNEYERVQGRLHRLAGGQGVYLPVGDQTTLVVDPYLPPRKRSSYVKDEDLEVGMFVVLRTGRSGNAVVQVANTLLGRQAGLYNDGQLLWKSALRKQIDVLGMDGVQRRLAAAGVRTAATALNIRNWASGAVIAPERASDFGEILKLCGLEAEQTRLWDGVRAIRQARHRAGQRIRAALEEQLEQVEVDQLVDDGEEILELPEFPQVRLGAFQVTWRSPTTTQVNRTELERVIAARDW